MKGKGGKTFETGDLVFAKVRGYPPWPARVINPTAKSGSKYQVFFFGTYETAVVKREDMWHFSEESKAKYGKQKRKGFAEGLLELEENPDIGMVADAPPVPMEALDSTAETSALDTTADVTAAPTDKSVVQTPAPVSQRKKSKSTETKEDQDESELTIDETPKKAAANNKANKRKAEDTPGSAAPPAKKKVAKNTPVAASTPIGKSEPKTPAVKSEQKTQSAVKSEQKTPAAVKSEQKTPAPFTPETNSSTPTAPTSRSGRVIKAKKFADADLSPLAAKSASPAPLEKKPSVAAPFEAFDGNLRKVWVNVKDTGDVLEINLDKDRPAKFDSKDAEIQWEKATAKNALKFKQSVESGEFIPEDIKKKLEEKTNRTPQEQEVLNKEKTLAARKEKVRWLKVEQRLADIDLDIKTALHYQRPNMIKCIGFLDELLGMPVAPLMFKKQPDIVTTIRKLRKYIGPEEDPVDEKAIKDMSNQAQNIRLKSEHVFKKLQSCFTVPEGKTFWEAFEVQLTHYKKVIKDMDQEQVIHLVNDPSA